MKVFHKRVFQLCLILCLTMFFQVQVSATSVESAEQIDQTIPSEPTGPQIIESLKTPVITSLKATSKGAIKLQWTESDSVDYYEVYRTSSSDGAYKVITTTKKKKYTDTSGKKFKTYYYKVRAVKKGEQENTLYVSSQSAKAKGTVRKEAKKVAYVGDSVMTGFRSYGVIKDTKSHKMFAEIGMNSGKFYSDSPLMGKLLKYNPDRMFIMMGVNGLVGSPNGTHMDSMIESYDKILAACLKKNPNMEIIVLGVSPVGKSARVKASSVKLYNQKLKKKVSKRKNVRFYDLAEFMADSNGYLKSQYGGGDGIHWRVNTYKDAYKQLQKYVKEFEERP